MPTVLAVNPLTFTVTELPLVRPVVGSAVAAGFAAAFALVVVVLAFVSLLLLPLLLSLLHAASASASTLVIARSRVHFVMCPPVRGVGRVLCLAFGSVLIRIAVTPPRHGTAPTPV